MEVIDDCTVFFLGILPRTLLPTGKSSSPFLAFYAEQDTRKLSKKNSVDLRQRWFVMRQRWFVTHDKPTLLVL